MSNMEQATSLFEIPERSLTLKQDNVYTITAKDFYEQQSMYKQYPLPNNILFPWLHGVDGLSNQQNLFFGVRRSLPPNYRGIMVIHCDEKNTARLVDSVLPEQVLDPSTGEFYANNEKSINLRNFSNQVSRFATLCDIIVYGPQAELFALAISEAQKSLYTVRQQQLEAVQSSAGKKVIANANTIVYKTIIIKDEFSVIEGAYPDLVMYDSTGFLRDTHADFSTLENIEMRKMSGANEVTKNVWIGNTQDAPVSIQEIKDIMTDEEEEEDFPNDGNDNPHNFIICIEAHDLADMPLPSTLMLARETLNDLNDKHFEIIHFDVYATGVPQEKNEFEGFYTRLVCLLEFMQDQSTKGRNILIHCSDGYTETSLLALSWIMYHLKLSLPEAYLYLQKKRSFFVYAADIPTLRRIEHLLFGDEVVEPSPKRKKSLQYENSTIQMRRLSTDESDESDMEEQQQQSPKIHRVLQADTYLNEVSNGIGNNLPEEKGCIYKQLQLSPTKEESMLYPWFYSPRFEGSFPSRILPFLYLGNLNHATNPDMLKALGITHVISVGEKADLSPQDFKLLFLDNLYDDGIDSIHNRLDSVMEFVENARLNNTLCLIHCRVGVSRSAAITICYVMKHLKYTLMDAYLFVRARRLNVIIQPNLKFMYEMLQLEQREKGTTTISWPILCQKISNLNFSYR